MKYWSMRTARSNDQRAERGNWRIKAKGEENFKEGVTALTDVTGSYERLGQKNVDLTHSK